MTTTVLADDHPTIRQGVRTILEGLDRCQVVGEASDDRTALELFLP